VRIGYDRKLAVPVRRLVGEHRVANRLLRRLVLVGDLADYLIGLIVEREFGSHASLIVFLALYALVLWVAWLLAVWMTAPKHAVPTTRL